jgi:hypothetical protein
MGTLPYTRRLGRANAVHSFRLYLLEEAIVSEGQAVRALPMAALMSLPASRWKKERTLQCMEIDQSWRGLQDTASSPDGPGLACWGASSSPASSYHRPGKKGRRGREGVRWEE